MYPIRRIDTAFAQHKGFSGWEMPLLTFFNREKKLKVEKFKCEEPFKPVTHRIKNPTTRGGIPI
jgi:hypothetical protein